MDFKLKNDNPWDTLQIPDGSELAVGTKVYNGSRKMLVNGVEQMVAEQCYGGEYSLDNGKLITIVDGVITEIADAPASMKVAAEKRAKEYKR